MGDEKQEGKSKLRFCGRCIAVGSFLLLVPLVRKLRERRHEQHHHRRFPLLGH